MIQAQISEKGRNLYYLNPTAHKEFIVTPGEKVQIGTITVFEGTTLSETDLSLKGPYAQNSVVAAHLMKFNNAAGFQSQKPFNGPSQDEGTLLWDRWDNSYGSVLMASYLWVPSYPGSRNHITKIDADGSATVWRAVFVVLQGVDLNTLGGIPERTSDSGLNPSITFTNSTAGSMGIAGCMSNTSGDAATSSTSGGQVAIEDSSGNDYGAYKPFTGASGTMSFTHAGAYMQAYLLHPAKFKRRIL